MFEDQVTASAGGAWPAALRPEAPVLEVGRVDTRSVAGWVGLLAAMDRAVGDGERVDQIRVLEELKSAAAAAQAVATADLVASQCEARRLAGACAQDASKGVGAQVALARRDSPFRGGRHVGLAQALVHEMPGTLAALRAGQISEWRATLVVRETACLTREDRRVADAELAERLPGMGDAQTEAAARAVAHRLDPVAFTARSQGAVGDRRVTLRPAPDTMSRLTGFLPVAQGVAAQVALTRHADALRAAGDPRSRGQIMADTLVERVTGQASAAGVPVEVNLVMTDTALFGGADDAASEDRACDEPAHLLGLGPLPAPMARDLLRDTEAAVWLRRVFTRPEDGALVALESRRRLFPDGLRRLLVLRDQTCRTPWCGAPIRHGDHVIPVESGGATSAANGQGLCEACNHTKTLPGWRARPGPGGAGESVAITTPTGHAYTSRPPPVPGQRPRGRPPLPQPSWPPPDASPLEARLRQALDAA